MEFKEILELIKFVSKSGVSEVRLETGNFKITIRTPENLNHTPPSTQRKENVAVTPVLNTQSPPVNQATATNTPAVLAKEPANNPSDKSYILKAPMVGTFYRSSAPDKQPFINVGDEVRKGQVLCIIEAMKLFNEIESEVDGKVVKVLVDDAKPVEFDQPLFVIENR